jgi:hypothetical protein
MKRMILLLVLVLSLPVAAQNNKDEPQFGIRFSGFVRNDIFYDTRQSSASNSLREGHFFLYPDNVLPDAEGIDINKNPSFHMLNIQTRLKGDITGPDAFGAKTSGVIEAEFFGSVESDINGFRLRHAFVKMDWSKTSLLIGQYWHPLFITESFPGTISFNTGAPFTPFSRNPQVRLTRTFGKISASVTAYSQRDFVSSGPDGNSSKYMRNSGLPGLNAQLRGQAGQMFTGFVGFDYKNLRPELRTSANVETNVRVGSFAAFTNMKLKTKPVTVSLMCVLAQNAFDLVMLGGYGVSKVTDSTTMLQNYTCISTASGWANISTNGNKFTAGLFAGYSANLGAKDDIFGAYYSRGSNIDHLFRISPRVSVTEGKLSFSAELENTFAAYGVTQTDGTVSNAESVVNTRLLIATVYNF